jgi:TolA-binding protein
MANNDSKQLALLTQAIQKLVDNPVAVVAPVAPVLPIAPVNQEDHNLLIRLDQKVDSIQLDVTDLKKQNNIYVTQTEHSEVVKVQSDHETRIRTLETSVTKVMQWGTISIILLGIIEFLVQKFL